jgi:ABC-type multidrug transport system ATPase subunit
LDRRWGEIGVGQLRVRTGGLVLVLTGERPLLLGRDAAADVRFDDHRVSRRHALIRFEGGGWLVEDLGSSNGTFVDGARVSAHVVAAPVRIRLGSPADGPEVDLEPLLAEPAPPPRAPAEMTVALAAAGPAAEGADAGPGAVDLGRRVAVHPIRSGVVRIGRAPDCDIVLADPHVSRNHAELRWEERGGWQVRDLGSHNGTYVNGRRITVAPLREGDILSLGRRHLRLVGGTLEEHESGDVRLDAVDLGVHTREGRALLEHVSLSIEKGAFVAVVGPSGAGKTTLLNALTGFKPADQGAVFYGGRNLYTEYDELRRRIGYVPQDDIVHAQLTVRQALRFAAELRFPRDVPAAEREHRVDEVMQELGLTERANLTIEKLSGGQRKRVNIGVELLTKPSPLFLDEPTSGLDPGLERGIMTLLRDLARGGRTIVVVTHAVQSLNLCDRVLVMAPGGRVAYYGPPAAALAYFGRTDFVDVFTDIEAGRDTAWDQRFWATPDYSTYVAQPLRAVPQAPSTVELPPSTLRPPSDWPRQFWILTRRYLDTLVADWRNLAFLLLQAPVLGLVMLLVIGSGTFVRLPGHPSPPLAQTAVTILVLVMTMSGLVNAIREIVKEAPTYRRERFVGLSIPAYVLSKLAVLGPFTVIQAIIVVLIGFASQSGPSKLLLIVDAACTGLAAMALGLMVSAMMRSTDKALSVLLLVLVVELVMAMPILDIAHKAVLGEISWLSSARWGVDAVGSTVNLNVIQPMGLPGSHPEWDQGFWPLSGELLMLLLLTAACIAGAVWLLHRQDPTLLTRPRRVAPPAAVPAAVAAR